MSLSESQKRMLISAGVAPKERKPTNPASVRVAILPSPSRVTDNNNRTKDKAFRAYIIVYVNGEFRQELVWIPKSVGVIYKTDTYVPLWFAEQLDHDYKEKHDGMASVVYAEVRIDLVQSVQYRQAKRDDNRAKPQYDKPVREYKSQTADDVAKQLGLSMDIYGDNIEPPRTEYT
jgi:hypothetical protein